MCRSECGRSVGGGYICSPAERGVSKSPTRAYINLVDLQGYIPRIWLCRFRDVKLYQCNVMDVRVRSRVKNVQRL